MQQKVKILSAPKKQIEKMVTSSESYIMHPLFLFWRVESVPGSIVVRRVPGGML
jgi:hypothetical protein